MTSGYYVGTGYGEEGVAYWAEKYTQTNNPIYLVPGSFSALWTPETYVQTAWTLLTAYQLNNAFVRPHYSQVQYYPSNNPSYPSKWSTRGTANNPPYSLGDDARKALNLPKYNPGDAVRDQKINPFKPLLGPGSVDGGTGIEYYRGWRWPK